MLREVNGRGYVTGPSVATNDGLSYYSSMGQQKINPRLNSIDEVETLLGTIRMYSYRIEYCWDQPTHVERVEYAALVKQKLCSARQIISTHYIEYRTTFANPP